MNLGSAPPSDAEPTASGPPEILRRLLSATTLEKRRPLHLGEASGSSPAWFAAHLATSGRMVVLVTTDATAAERTARDLNAFAPHARVVELPAPEASPYDTIRPDRRLSRVRAAALSALAGRRADIVVTTIRAWVRRTPPQQALTQHETTLRAGTPLDLGRLTRRLEEAGYERTPIVEDPGEFTVRGELVDLWPAGATVPYRVELEFDEIARIRPFDPENQRRGEEEIGLLHLEPCRESCLSDSDKQQARQQIRDLCDAAHLPSSRARMLADDALDGRQLLTGASLLPASYNLVALTDYLPADALLLFVNAPEVVSVARNEISAAQTAYESRPDEPRFPVAAHLLTDEALDATIAHHACAALQPGNVLGGHETGFSSLAAPGNELLRLGYRGQTELARRLAAERKTHGGLDPLLSAIKWEISQDNPVVLTARVETQARRLVELLEHRGLKVRQVAPELLAVPQNGPAAHAGPAPLFRHELEDGQDAVSVVVSTLSQGMSSVWRGPFLLAEEEIFGRRMHRHKQSSARAIQNAIDDLRSLAPGHLVVHREHGIGRYVGLEHRAIAGATVDLLVVEYQGGDRLYLPAYRLNQVQKYSGAEAAPRLDRLGGQTFSKTKSQAKRRVRIIADQLLQLYAEREAAERPPLPPPSDDYAAFEAAFPFEETPDQAGAIQDVISDLQAKRVMDRLVCGDVGFGKTEVAVRAAYLNVLEGRQVALLCPTTVLAEQHFRTLEQRLLPTGAIVRVLSRFQNRKSIADTLARLKNGQVDVVVGTHRLLSKDVLFSKLGLLVVDEEQRFGVTHKERIKQMRKSVDVLTLSATPIPRTLGLAVSGLRDMSVIATAPVNRRAIRTFTSRFDPGLIASAVERELARGGQVFYVYNRVEGLAERAALIESLVPGARVGIAHGQMNERELERTMLGFVAGEFDVLATTAIVESGLDIPRANTIIIDRADLFGLAQLYQLRGRVGRSSERATCYLLLPENGEVSDEARQRIEALEQYTELGSGFHIATLDMELRGAGELLGADQSGFMERIGFELFSQMLEEATKELSGQSYVPELDPDLSLDIEAFLPESYVPEVGVRLGLYKRYASALRASEVDDLDDELSDRFGSLPPEARRFSEMMRVKVRLRALRALRLTATPKSVTLHLASDTPIAPSALAGLVAKPSEGLALTPDGCLTRRQQGPEVLASGLEHALLLVDRLETL